MAERHHWNKQALGSGTALGMASPSPLSRGAADAGGGRLWCRQKRVPTTPRSHPPNPNHRGARHRGQHPSRMIDSSRCQTGFQLDLSRPYFVASDDHPLRPQPTTDHQPPPAVPPLYRPIPQRITCAAHGAGRGPLHSDSPSSLPPSRPSPVLFSGPGHSSSPRPVSRPSPRAPVAVPVTLTRRTRRISGAEG